MRELEKANFICSWLESHFEDYDLSLEILLGMNSVLLLSS